MKVSLNFEFNGNEEAEAFLRQVRERAAQMAQHDSAPSSVSTEDTLHSVPEQVAVKRGRKKKEPPAEAPAAPVEQPVHTREDAQTALQKLFEAKGLETARAVLSRYGVQRLQDMRPEAYTPFVAHVESVLAGGEV